MACVLRALGWAGGGDRRFQPIRFVHPHRYASASRTVSRDARDAGARVASAAPRTTTTTQMTIAIPETRKGKGPYRNRLPSPALITAVRRRAGRAATI